MCVFLYENKKKSIVHKYLHLLMQVFTYAVIRKCAKHIFLHTFVFIFSYFADASICICCNLQVCFASTVIMEKKIRYYILKKITYTILSLLCTSSCLHSGIGSLNAVGSKPFLDNVYVHVNKYKFVSIVHPNTPNRSKEYLFQLQIIMS